MNSLCKKILILGVLPSISLMLATGNVLAETINEQKKKKLISSSGSNWKGSLIVEGIYFNGNSHDDEHEEDDHDDDEDHDEEEHAEEDGEHHEDEDEHAHEEEEGHGHEEVSIPGFPSGGHDHGYRNGLHTGHIEAVVSGNISDKLAARITVGMQEIENEGLEIELEEAFVETQGLGNGFTLKGGRFFTDVGYLSSKHNHEWDFADSPLIYRGMFGAHPNFDGAQLSYVAPTDTYLELGAELFKGDKFPAGNSDNTIGAYSLFAKIGGDFNLSNSWQLGLGHWKASDINGRTGDEHGHEEEHGHDDEDEMESFTEGFSGKSQINTINAVYKWAPNGNSKERNFKLQAEYFQRDEKGEIGIEDDGIDTTLNYDGKQNGFYIQGIYQFRPRWRVGLRHDRLDSNNKFSLNTNAATEEQIDATGLSSEGHTPKRNSIMIDYTPREYSRLRLQFNEDKATDETDRQLILQYTHSFGSHGAHGF